MKKNILALLVCALVVFSGSAWSYTIGVTPDPIIDVGAIDTFLDAEDLGNSGDTVELSWVNTFLMDKGLITTPYTTMVKVEYDNPSDVWKVTNESSKVYAAQFNSYQPEFFFIKTGNTSTGDHFLYQNVAELNWAVVDLAQSGVEIKNIGKFSHIGEVGTAVPEPSALLLLGFGLVGLAGVGVRKFRK